MAMAFIAHGRARSLACAKPALGAASPLWAPASTFAAARLLHQSNTLRQEAAASTSSDGPTADVRAKLKDALKTAMKARDKSMTTTIKSALSDITYQEKSSSKPNEAADNGTVIEVMRKAIEKRRQASEAYPEGDAARIDLLREVDLLSSFLPQTLGPEAIESKLQQIISGLTPEARLSRSATGIVLAEFWKQVEKSEVADKKSLGKIIAEQLKAIS